MSESASLRGRIEHHVEENYTIWLIILGLAGWAMASYDFNLLILTIPNISEDLGLSASAVGSLVFIIYAAQFFVTLLVGRAMDDYGRLRVWQWALVGTAIFTGLTYFVAGFWQLAVVRVLASAFAQSELAISITLINEQAPTENRGFLYSIVQGGWPVGVFLASGIYSLFIGYGWRVVFVIGILPLIVVIFGRWFLHESEQWEALQEIRQRREESDDVDVSDLTEEYDIDPAALESTSYRKLFSTPGPIRRQLVLLSIVWLFYAASFVATNSYITDWLTRYGSWSAGQTGTLLLVAGGIGFFFYLIGGYLGEQFGRREVLIGTAIFVAPLNLLFYFYHPPTLLGWLVYLAIYQATNGTWSGAGYAYWAESFPTRVRGSAVGWLGSMFALGLFIGSGIWTLVVSSANLSTAWLVVAVGLALGQLLVFWLPHIEPGKPLEDANVERIDQDRRDVGTTTADSTQGDQISE
ncbi:MAG TPA: MFS transporter [Halococcus sp.]|nr:MFS transporter [Halococcus sp.]